MGKDLLYSFRKFHGYIHEKVLHSKEKKALKAKYLHMLLQRKKHNSKCLFLVLTPEHSNLGDHAIAAAEAELLQQNGIEYVEITGKQLVELQRKKALSIMNGHPIVINGGGNLGTLWFDVEQLMRDIIFANPKSPIFILPNTIYYEDSEWGKQEFERSVKLYNAHENLFIYAREQFSFNKMHGVYKNVKLMPDMVMGLNECEKKTQRHGCLLCLRSDREKTCTEQEKAMLLQEMQTIFGDDIVYTDMHAQCDVSITDREEELQKKYTEFRSAALVVTDRLHGMIFCAITATPCIVINSQSPKVKGCYEWLKELEYICFCDDVTKISQLYNAIPKRTHDYNNIWTIPYFKELIHDIIERI